LAGLREALNEEAGELRFEAGPVGDLVEAVGGALLGGPEFVDVGRNLDVAAVGQRRGRRSDDGRTAKVAERPQLVLERTRRGGGPLDVIRIADGWQLECHDERPRLHPQIMVRWDDAGLRFKPAAATLLWPRNALLSSFCACP